MPTSQQHTHKRAALLATYKIPSSHAPQYEYNTYGTFCAELSKL